MEKHQREVNKRVAAMLEGMTDGFVLLDSQWHIIYMNPWVETALGRSRDELIGRNLWEIAPDLLGTPFEQYYRAAMITQQAKHFDAFHPDFRKWVEVHVYPQPEGISIYTIDITERKHMEEALRESKEALRVMTETIPQLMWTARPDGFLEYFNQQCFSYLDATYEQLQGQGWLRVVHPDDQQRTLDTWRNALQTGKGYEIEYRLREGKTGRYQWFLARATPLVDEQGHILKWFGTTTNIDEKKRIEKALQESETRFRGLVEANIIGIIVIDVNGSIHEANDAFLALVGYSREDVVAGNLHWTDLTPPEHQERTLQAREELLTTGRFQAYEKEFFTKAGERRPVLIGATIFRWEDHVPLAIAFVVDLTARKELERQKDLFLGMTGHELKTPLAALRGTLQLLQRRSRRLPSLDDLPTIWSAFVEGLTKDLEKALRLIDVQTRFINDLLDVSRFTAKTFKLSLEPCDLVNIIRRSIEDLRATEPERSLILVLPEQTSVIVLADPDRISQVVTNYVSNALRYSPARQPVHIGLTIEDRNARVWVQDHGPGLSSETQKDIWQCFHQAKEVPVLSGSGKGLGLGLYICQMLIMQHQGEVGVESTPGEGSTFWFRLPFMRDLFPQQRGSATASRSD